LDHGCLVVGGAANVPSPAGVFAKKHLVSAEADSAVPPGVAPRTTRATTFWLVTR
jgi:hypothetical protein